MEMDKGNIMKNNELYKDKGLGDVVWTCISDTDDDQYDPSDSQVNVELREKKRESSVIVCVRRVEYVYPLVELTTLLYYWELILTWVAA